MSPAPPVGEPGIDDEEDYDDGEEASDEEDSGDDISKIVDVVFAGK